jgi:hypothetical protein
MRFPDCHLARYPKIMRVTEVMTNWLNILLAVSVTKPVIRIMTTVVNTNIKSTIGIQTTRIAMFRKSLSGNLANCA